MIKEPPEVLALAALREILSDLSGERPGGWTYPQTPSVVGWPLPPPGQQMNRDELPRLYVVAASGSTLEGAGIKGAALAYRKAFLVDIYGVIRGDDTATADTWRWRLLDDVLMTLHQNWTLFKTAMDGIDITQRPQGLDTGEFSTDALFIQPVTVRLRPWAPTTLPAP
jgi:hypothetical protein